MEKWEKEGSKRILRSMATKNKSILVTITRTMMRVWEKPGQFCTCCLFRILGHLGTDFPQGTAYYESRIQKRGQSHRYRFESYHTLVVVCAVVMSENNKDMG